MVRRAALLLVLALTAALAPSGIAAPAVAADPDATFTWEQTSLTVGDQMQVTVTGENLTSATKVILRRVDKGQSQNGPIVDSGEITPEQPTITLADTVTATGPQAFYVRVEPRRYWSGYGPYWSASGRRVYQVAGRPTTLQVRYPAVRSVKVDQKKTITGQASGTPGRVVRVETQGSNGTWVPMATTTTDPEGHFKMPAPTWWAAKQTLRVHAPGTSVDAAAVTETVQMTVRAPGKPRGSNAFTYLMQGRKARFNPCRLLTYRINPQRAPRNARAAIAKAFTKISRASGLRFQYAGKTSHIPFAEGRHASAYPDNTDLVIAWATPEQAPGLAGKVAGRGGTRGAWEADGGWWELYDGGATFDATQELPGRTRKDRKILKEVLYLHEIAHALGLGHVNDPQQIMRPGNGPGVAEFGAGDLRGLAAIGATQGCLRG